MCIIAIKPKNKKMFDENVIRTMFYNNPDGAGYMYYDYSQKCVVIKKGFMSVKALLASLNEKNLDNTNVVLHFRIGTSGKNNALNCHPYPIYQKNALNCATNIGMAHNGILSDYVPGKTSEINDTQVFIQKVLSNLKKGFQYDTDKLALINELIGTNKLAFLDNKNKVTTIGNFINDGGYIYSNTSYKPHTYVYKTPKASPNGNKIVCTPNAKNYEYTSEKWYKGHEKNDGYTSFHFTQADLWGDDSSETDWFWDDFNERYMGL